MHEAFWILDTLDLCAVCVRSHEEEVLGGSFSTMPAVRPASEVSSARGPGAELAGPRLVPTVLAERDGPSTLERLASLELRVTALEPQHDGSWAWASRMLVAGARVWRPSVGVVLAFGEAGILEVEDTQSYYLVRYGDLIALDWEVYTPPAAEISPARVLRLVPP